jgi:sulfur transfer protein SufE
MTDQADQAPTVEELQESIDELSAYRERLYNDVIGLGKKTSPIPKEDRRNGQRTSGINTDR